MKIHLVSDFNLDILKRFVEASFAAQTNAAPMEVTASPVNQALPTLLQLSQAATKNDAVVLVALAEQMLPEFQRAKRLESYQEAKIFEELDSTIRLLKSISGKAKFVVATSLQNTFNEPGYGILDWRPGLGLRHLLAKMNLYFAEQMADQSNFFLLESNELHHRNPGNYSSKLWYAAKSPYSNQAYKNFAAEIVSAMRAIQGQSRRLIVLDLDNTLWGGVVGESGWPGVRLGGHDHIGEAFKDFQKALKILTKRGVQLAIVSKNDESVALDAIDNHPEMILKRNDFAGWRINWNDKAANVADLLNEINLGAASAVFIDDNPVERERVRGSLHEVLVPEWPTDPALYTQAIWNLGCFDVPALTEEDRSRTAMYVAERSRKEVKAQVESVEDWLSKLGTEVIVEPLNDKNLPRVAQLYNKTNQLNLTTRRMSPAEIADWAKSENRRVWSITVKDRFGDLGLTGVIGLEHQNDKVQLVDYILSCRVMGRMVEETMFHLAASWARARDAKQLVATYVPTPRNRPTLETLAKAQLREEKQNEFLWICEQVYAKPESVTVHAPPDVLAEL